MQTNLADLLTIAAAEEPHRIALSEAATGRAIHWSALEDLTDRVVAGLDRLGVVGGQRVMIAMSNRIEFVAAYLGVLRARAVAVPVNARSATGEILASIVDSGARVVIADGGTLDVVRTAVTGLTEAISSGAEGFRSALDEDPIAPVVVAVSDDPVGGVAAGEVSWQDFVAEEGQKVVGREDPEALAVLLYTSGTSGRPRGAMLSHRALLGNIEQIASVQPPMIVGQDVVLGVLPLFHVYGLNAVLGQVLKQHARLVLVNGFDAEEALDLIEDEAISVVPVAPPVIAYWMQVPSLSERLGPVRLVLSGSAPLDPALTAAFVERTGIAVHQGYGLTEAAPVVTSTLGSARTQPRTVGTALPGIELRLVDEVGREPEGEAGGQILVRGANLFSGYWHDGSDGPDAEGWFATGDVGYLDGDGDLFLVDRLKELVIVSGFNVYPSEVEDVVREIDEVVEAAVIGVPDELTGEAVVAYVKPRDDVDPAAVVDLVRERCAARLARFKQPSQVHVVDSFPHTVTGKVQKGRLRATERRRALGLLED